MQLEPPAEWDAHPYEYAEWLELLAIQRWPNPSGEAELRSHLEGIADDLKLFASQDELEDKVESKVQAVFEELSKRLTWSEGGYPFKLENGTILLKTETDQITTISDSSIAYIFALGATFYRHKYFRNLRKPKDENDKFPGKANLENLFQVCGTIAAAGFVNGHSISFGHPRVDGSGFYAKLASVGNTLGDGVPKAGWAPGASPKPNDGAVDIIAWRHCPDKQPGQLYMLGQCASGDNWEEGKVPVLDHDNFHEYYWSSMPHSPLITATFLPFDFRTFVMKTLPCSLQEAWWSERWRLTKSHGVIVDRFRLAHYFASGLQTAHAGKHKVESIDKLPELRAWNEAFINFFKT
jgi:hypothetical protein